MNETANVLIKVWKPAHVPLMTKVNVIKKIRSLVKSYVKFKYYKKETSSLVTFCESLKQRIMIAAEDAENLIMKDTDLLPKDEKEDLKFLAMLKDNKTVSLGKVDRELYKRIAKKKARKSVPETSRYYVINQVIYFEFVIW